MESQEQAQFESIRGNLLKDIYVNFGLLFVCSILLLVIGFYGIVLTQLIGWILIIKTCQKSLAGAKLIVGNSMKTTLVTLYGLIVPFVILQIIFFCSFIFSGFSMVELFS